MASCTTSNPGPCQSWGGSQETIAMLLCCRTKEQSNELYPTGSDADRTAHAMVQTGTGIWCLQLT